MTPPRLEVADVVQQYGDLFLASDFRRPLKCCNFNTLYFGFSQR